MESQTLPWHFTTETNIECGLTMFQGSFNSPIDGGVAVVPDGGGWTILGSPAQLGQTSPKVGRAMCVK